MYYKSARIINLTAGVLLFILGLVGFFIPEWFFTAKYDVLTPTPQAKTILRVMMGFMATIGALWLFSVFVLQDPKKLLAATIIMTLGFVLSRLGGLMIDGWAQTHTYHELIFEIMALFISLWVYSNLNAQK